MDPSTSYVAKLLHSPADKPLKKVAEEAAELAEAIIDPLPDDGYPNLVELAQEHVLQPGYSFGAEFEFGLDLILDALEARV